MMMATFGDDMTTVGVISVLVGSDSSAGCGSGADIVAGAVTGAEDDGGG